MYEKEANFGVFFVSLLSETTTTLNNISLWHYTVLKVSSVSVCPIMGL